MRDALLKSGVIEAVIAVGSGTSAGSMISTNILVLRKVGVVMNSVRMIDARDVGHLVNGRRSFTNEEIESIVAALRGKGGQGTGGKIKVLDVPLKEILENGSVLNVNRYITDALQVKSLDESIRIFENTVNALKLSLYQVSGVVDSGNFRALAQVKNQYDSECEMYPLNQIDNPSIVSLFKNRLKGSDWRDVVRQDDIVVSIAGSQVGQAMMGLEFLERNIQWSRVWIIRTQSDKINPRYIAAWATFGGLELQIRPLVSGSTISMLVKRDLDRVVIPIPSRETQNSIALLGETATSLANVFKNFGDTQNEFLTSLRNLGISFFSDFNNKGDDQ